MIGFAIPHKDLQDPPSVQYTTDVNVKTIVAKGKSDESSTSQVMELAAERIPGPCRRNPEAAHMVHLESVRESQTIGSSNILQQDLG